MKSSSSANRRADGRKPLLVYLDPKIIRSLKRRALDEDTHVYIIVEKILRDAQANKA
jgi:hypothetical protein